MFMIFMWLILKIIIKTKRVVHDHLTACISKLKNVAVMKKIEDATRDTSCNRIQLNCCKDNTILTPVKMYSPISMVLYEYCMYELKSNRPRYCVHAHRFCSRFNLGRNGTKTRNKMFWLWLLIWDIPFDTTFIIQRLFCSSKLLNVIISVDDNRVCKNVYSCGIFVSRLLGCSVTSAVAASESLLSLGVF